MLQNKNEHKIKQNKRKLSKYKYDIRYPASYHSYLADRVTRAKYAARETDGGKRSL